MASRRIEDLHPAFQPLVRRFLDACEKAGHNLIITSGLRTTDEQRQLYELGRTQPGKKVTNAPPGSSWHNYGLAVDVVFVKDGKAWWTGPWEAIGRIGEQLGMVWGGRFRLGDYAHFEWHPGLTLKQAGQYLAAGRAVGSIPLRA